LPRIAVKTATGSGKNVVTAMLIAWQALNKLENRQDARFSDAFLLVRAARASDLRWRTQTGGAWLVRCV